MAKKGDRVGVTTRAAIARVNRKLKPDLKALKATRGERFRQEQGDYYVLDYRSRWIVEKHVDVEAYARELGVLHEWERVVED
jgi:hypothetical protein